MVRKLLSESRWSFDANQQQMRCSGSFCIHITATDWKNVERPTKGLWMAGGYDLLDEIEAVKSSDHKDDLKKLRVRVSAFADELAHRPNVAVTAAPMREIERIAELGLLTAPLPVNEGGLGLGVDATTEGTLYRVLSALGGGDLALGRIYEGHVNGLLLVQRYGSAEQVARLADDVGAGMLSGVWNTGRPEVLRLIAEDGGYRYEGVKTFATGAAFVQRPVVTAELAGRGWQMTLPRMEEMRATVDKSFWHPLGMESSESYGVDFSGGHISEDALIGDAGDFYRDPMFRGGAVRFAAVQAGGVMRLHAMFAEWLDATGRGDDPYQVARLGEVAIASQEAAMWVEKAAAISEESHSRVDKAHGERVIEFANMMRVAIERLGTGVMQRVTSGVGAHGLLQPARFERVIRDLMMYLRQPAPDATLAAVGRSSLEKSHKRTQGSSDGFWSDECQEESLPTKYFDRIYTRKRDPWNFETSEYEKAKYAATLAALPLGRYQCGLEVGCSIGVLTALLAERCQGLLALDLSERALAVARARCAEMPQVTFARMRVPYEMPDERFDLMVVSEVAYYWSLADLKKAADGLAVRHKHGGHLVLVHLTEKVADYPLTGDEVHEYWLTRREWTRVGCERHEMFRIDVLQRNEGPVRI
jgi:alkylation response protein AidB-like acyl-CoA dehydrogenase/protein-L-isoaspartate O-methyltransferase